jgi:hypothetical protein
MLNRFIIIGGPYFDPGPELQQKLQDQVGFIFAAAPKPALAPYWSYIAQDIRLALL